MKLTTKGRFAVTAMLDLTLNGQGGPVSLSAISERQTISVAYLEQIFCKLRRAGLVVSVRGPGGGYRLGDAPDKITVGSIIEAVDENIDATQCRGEGHCQGGVACMTHHLWEELNNITKKFLDSVTLAGMAKSQEERQGRQVVPAVIPVKGRDTH